MSANKTFTVKQTAHLLLLQPSASRRKKHGKKKNSEKLQRKVLLFIQVAGDAHHQRFFQAINNLQREVIFKLAEP